MSFFNNNPLDSLNEEYMSQQAKTPMRDTISSNVTTLLTYKLDHPYSTRDRPILIFFVVAQCITLLSHLMIIKERQTLHPICYAYNYTSFFFLLPFSFVFIGPTLCGEEIFTPSHMVKDLMNPPWVTPFIASFEDFLSILCP
jgi:hypothetical protein